MSYAQFLTTFGNDLATLAASIVLLLVYHPFLAYKVKHNPAYSVQSVNVIARTAWVHSIMNVGKKDVLLIQTFRNSTMASTFLASTSALLIMGAMSLSGQADKLDSSWHALKNPNWTASAAHAAAPGDSWSFSAGLAQINRIICRIPCGFQPAYAVYRRSPQGNRIKLF